MLDLPEPIAVVCHDAGAANIILSWIAQGDRHVRPAMAGPAAALWQARFPNWPLLSGSEEALEGARSLLSGSGWATDHEHDARQQARGRGVMSAAVIDHWVNYRARFVRRGDEVLPDEIWVTDPYALAMAKAEFPDMIVRLKPNLYLEEQVARIHPPPPEGRGDVLYVLEPFRDDWGGGRPAEIQALDYFMAGRAALGIRAETPIRLRPHPTETPAKYAAWIAAQQDADVRIDGDGDMAAALSDAEWVVGCQSFALLIALRAGRKVVSALPPNAPPCGLPFPGLVHLREILTGEAKPCGETEKD
ncbi:MAG: hypothetical protein ACXWU2_07455 [Allosphingosinicella sp.]